MCGRFALSLAPRVIERRARDEWIPDLHGWHESADEHRSEHSPTGDDEAQHQDQSNASKRSPSKKACLPFEHGYRVGNYNVSPSTNVPVIYRAETSEGVLAPPALLAMVPSWMKELPDHASSLRTINARDDTVLSGSGLWKVPRSKRRCVVLAEGFYEWQKKGGDKIPHFVKRQDGRLMCIAGLYDIAHLKDRQEPLYSFTIITTDNNPQLSFLHDRMPVILRSVEQAERWLDTTTHEFSEDIAKLLKPFDGPLECYAVPKEVGKTSENSPDFIRPVAERMGNIASFFQKQAETKPPISPKQFKGGSPKEEQDHKERPGDKIKHVDSAPSRGTKRSHSPKEESSLPTLRQQQREASGHKKLKMAAPKSQESSKGDSCTTDADSDVELVATSTSSKPKSNSHCKRRKDNAES